MLGGPPFRLELPRDSGPRHRSLGPRLLSPRLAVLGPVFVTQLLQLLFFMASVCATVRPTCVHWPPLLLAFFAEFVDFIPIFLLLFFPHGCKLCGKRAKV